MQKSNGTPQSTKPDAQIEQATEVLHKLFVELHIPGGAKIITKITP